MDSPSYPLHALLLLSDSALPLGAFAFSSGLESYLAHQKQKQRQPTPSSSSSSSSSTPIQSFEAFLHLSLKNLASTSLPYVLDAFHNPHHLPQLDNDFDASTPCTVARRASIAQGKALLQLWERALAPSASSSSSTTSSSPQHHLAAYLAAQKHPAPTPPPAAADPLPHQTFHYAPLFGTVCAALALPATETAYLFLLNHAKSLLSAAVRASVMGPYQSHAILASNRLQDDIKSCVREIQGKKVADAAVTVPVVEIWVARHEILYSRIFNS